MISVSICLVARGVSGTYILLYAKYIFPKQIFHNLPLAVKAKAGCFYFARFYL